MRLLFFIFILFFPLAAIASSPPLPASKAEALTGLQDRLEREKLTKQQLEEKLAAAERDMLQTKKELVQSGDLVRVNEKLLLELRERIKDMEERQASLSKQLHSDHAAMADLILALQRIRRVPPEALIVRPGGPLKTAQSALLLQTILPAIQGRAAEVSVKLNELALLQEQVAKDQAEAEKTQAILVAKYREISTLAEKRQFLYRSVNAGLNETKANIDRISKEAESLQELLAGLEAEKKRYAASAQARRGLFASATKIPATGTSRLPVSGIILTGYGEPDSIGAPSQGITIDAQKGALVVAPMGGIVRFAGDFKNYGRLIILEHEDNYHSLIGGLDIINIAVGEKVGAGEPVGKLPVTPSREGQPALYYELRYNGRPIDPSKKFSGLKS